jgi:hypothetical protein
MGLGFRKVDVSLPGKGNSNPHGFRVQEGRWKATWKREFRLL